MSNKRIWVSDDIYSEIESIRKRLIEKSGLGKGLSIRETMEIIWDIKSQDNLSIEEAIRKISQHKIKIAWGNHGRGSRKYRRGELNINLAATGTKVY